MEKGVGASFGYSGAGVRNSGNPPKQAPGCCSRDRAGWLVGVNVPAALSPAQGLGQNQ